MKVVTASRMTRIEIEYSQNEVKDYFNFVRKTYGSFKYTIIRSGPKNNETEMCLGVINVITPEDETLRNHYIAILNLRIEQEFSNGNNSSEDTESHF